MNIIAIEGRTFEQIKQRFENFTQQVKSLCGDNQDKEKWLGNDDVYETPANIEANITILQG